MSDQYGCSLNAAADPASVVQGDSYRFTVLTEQLIRMEYSPKGEFVDELSCRTDNPKHMEICAFMGADGSFTLYEDDGISMEYEAGKAARTEMKVLWNDRKGFVICPSTGELSLIPGNRDYTIRLFGIAPDALAQVLCDGAEITPKIEYDTIRHVLSVTIKGCDVCKELAICLDDEAELCENDLAVAGYVIINRTQAPFAIKEKLYKLLCSGKSRESILATMESMYMDEDFKSAVRELLLA